MDVIPLAADFPPAGHDAWLALVGKTLKGAPVESLTSFSYDGLPTAALYSSAEPQPDAVRFGAVRSQGAGRWDLRTIVAHPDPVTANAQVLQDLENAANSVLLRLDPTGVDGIAAAGPDDVARTIAGV